jgi:hypothetical protein
MTRVHCTSLVHTASQWHWWTQEDMRTLRHSSRHTMTTPLLQWLHTARPHTDHCTTQLTEQTSCQSAQLDN